MSKLLQTKPTEDDIILALTVANANVTLAGEKLGVSDSYIYDRIKKFPGVRQAFDSIRESKIKNMITKAEEKLAKIAAKDEDDQVCLNAIKLLLKHKLATDWGWNQPTEQNATNVIIQPKSGVDIRTEAEAQSQSPNPSDDQTND